MNERLRALRKAAGLTQAELARRAGLTGPEISYLETGRCHASERTRQAIGAALGIPEDQRAAVFGPLGRIGRPAGSRSRARDGIALWRCAPLRALLTQAACERNHERAMAASRSKRMLRFDGSHAPEGEIRMEAALALSSVGACIGCPGVVALAGRAGPERVVAREVRERPKPTPMAELPPSAEPKVRRRKVMRRPPETLSL